MLRYDIQQNQWLIASLALGLAVLATFVLGYIALWRRRDSDDRYADTAASDQGFAWAPWVLVVIWASTLVWGLIYMLMTAAYPPNW